MPKIYSVVAATGVIANSCAGALIRHFGLRAFATVATASSLLYWVGAATSHRAFLVLAVVGLLGQAR